MAALAEARGEPVPDPFSNLPRKDTDEWLARMRDRAEVTRLGRLALSDNVEERRLQAAERMAKQAADLTDERLAVRRDVQVLKAKSLVRGGASR